MFSTPTNVSPEVVLRVPAADRGYYPTRRDALDDLDVRDLKTGADVVCERDWPSAGTWPRYLGRAGRVDSVNVQVFPSGRGVYVELGVRFTNSKTESTTWFRPGEL